MESPGAAVIICDEVPAFTFMLNFRLGTCYMEMQLLCIAALNDFALCAAVVTTKREVLLVCQLKTERCVYMVPVIKVNVTDLCKCQS